MTRICPLNHPDDNPRHFDES